MRRREFLTGLGVTGVSLGVLVPLSWQTSRLAREAWALTRTPPVVLSPDESRALDLERSVLGVLSELASLPAGTVDDAALRTMTAAYRIQLSALTDARGAGPALVPPATTPSTLVSVRSTQHALVEQARTAALKADGGDYAMLFAAVAAGAHQQMGLLP